MPCLNYERKLDLMPHNILVATFLLLAIISWSLKLFTTEIYFSDDPTIIFAYKVQPSLVNRMIVRGEENVPDGYRILFAEENGYIGMSLYAFVVTWAWKISTIFMVIILAWYLRVYVFVRHDKCKKPSAP